MLKFLKNIMNNEKLNLRNDSDSLHRILKTAIKKDPNIEKMKLFLDVVVSGELKNVFGNFLELSQLL